jgi:PEP-CTERM motif
MTTATLVRASAGCFAILAAAAAHAQVADNTPGNLVTNGSMSFAGPNGPLAPGGDFNAGANPGALTGWSFLNAGPTAEYWVSFGGQASPDGTQYLGIQDLDTFAPRVNARGITQTVSGLTVGATYQLTFYSMSNHDDPGGSQDWQVTFGGDSRTGLVTGPNANQTGNWVQSTMSFTASAASEALTFMAQYLPGSVPEMLNLDGVVLTQSSGPSPVAAVPEPETYALIVGGLLAMRLVVRRRRLD